MKKTLIILSSLSALVATSSAADVDFSFDGDKTEQVLDGLEIVYSFSVTGDLDEAADGDDTFTWDVRFSAFERTITSDEVTLGTQVQANTDATEFNGAGVTTWNNESLVFAIENEVLTTTAAGSFNWTFNGFTEMFLTAGDFYLGTGGDTITLTSTGNSFDVFGAPQDSPLVITSTASERNRGLTASFTISAIPEPGTYALLAGLTGLVFVMVRRRRA